MELDLFSHGIESNPISTDIYQGQKERLSINAWIILFCLLEGQRLTPLDFVNGISFIGMLKVKIMCEYRRRLCELRDSGIEIESQICTGGFKQHWIAPKLLIEYQKDYLSYKNELLNKLR